MQRGVVVVLLFLLLTVGYAYYDAEKCGTIFDYNLIRERPRYHKVLGGGLARLGQAPWVVGIMNDDFGKGSFCSGSLISSRHVITAAHCFTNIHKKEIQCDEGKEYNESEVIQKFRISYGGVCTKLNPEVGCTNDMLNKESRVVSAKAYHRYFETNCTHKRDFGIMELEEDVPSFIPHICLPYRHDVDLYDKTINNLYGAGYGGDPLQHDSPPSRLQIVKLGLEAKCESMVMHNKYTMGSICTQQVNNTNVCEGDSGGPIYTLIDNRYYLKGLVSYGTECQTVLRDPREPLGQQVNVDVNYYRRTIDLLTNYTSPSD